jgi:hypothetical protein
MSLSAMRSAPLRPKALAMSRFVARSGFSAMKARSVSRSGRVLLVIVLPPA